MVSASQQGPKDLCRVCEGAKQLYEHRGSLSDAVLEAASWHPVDRPEHGPEFWANLDSGAQVFGCHM